MFGSLEYFRSLLDIGSLSTEATLDLGLAPSVLGTFEAILAAGSPTWPLLLILLPKHILIILSMSYNSFRSPFNFPLNGMLVLYVKP